jgi:hypothetical protein
MGAKACLATDDDFVALIQTEKLSLRSFQIDPSFFRVSQNTFGLHCEVRLLTAGRVRDITSASL